MTLRCCVLWLHPEVDIAHVPATAPGALRLSGDLQEDVGLQVRAHQGRKFQWLLLRRAAWRAGSLLVAVGLLIEPEVQAMQDDGHVEIVVRAAVVGQHVQRDVVFAGVGDQALDAALADEILGAWHGQAGVAGRVGERDLEADPPKLGEPRGPRLPRSAASLTAGSSWRWRVGPVRSMTAPMARLASAEPTAASDGETGG